MEKSYITTTKNGKSVYVDLVASHAATHIQDTPQLSALIKELLSATEVEGSEIYLDRDMGRKIGTTDLVMTSDEDEILYAKRTNRDNYTRFVKKRSAQPTNYLTVVLKKDSNGEYELFSTWIGRAVPPFPNDEYETTNSKQFWQKHALVWGNQAIQEGSEVYEWPW